MTTKESFKTLQDVFGEDVTYTPAGVAANAKTIRAVVDTSFPNQEDHPGRGSRFAVATILVTADDVTPGDRDQFTIRSNNWELAADGWEESQLNEYSTAVYRGNLVRLLS